MLYSRQETSHEYGNAGFVWAIVLGINFKS
jgi:hypothetical protein